MASGLLLTRAGTLVELAEQVADQKIDLENFVDPSTVLQQLQSIPGIGQWTAEYIGMRGLHWPDAFPAADLGLIKAYRNFSKVPVGKASEQWRPWRAYAALHLWHSLDGISRKKSATIG